MTKANYNYLLYVSVIVCLVIITVFTISIFKSDYQPTQQILPTESPLIQPGYVKSTEIQVHPAKSFDEDRFYQAIAQAKPANLNQNHFFWGGIIPHHTLPVLLIADFWQRLSLQKPETVILVGPNHFEKGNFPALTSVWGWSTSFGVLVPNVSIINNLATNNLVYIDEQALEQEHSIRDIVPFIKYYLPQTQIVPIILSSTTTQEQTTRLTVQISKLINRQTLIVAAVDFSHYLTSNQAQQKDEITLKVMQEFDYPELFKLNNDYLDSPAAIAIVLMTMQALGKTNLEILYHTNSGELLKDALVPTTSYFSIGFN